MQTRMICLALSFPADRDLNWLPLRLSLDEILSEGILPLLVRALSDLPSEAVDRGPLFS